MKLEKYVDRLEMAIAKMWKRAISQGVFVSLVSKENILIVPSVPKVFYQIASFVNRANF